MKTDKKRLTCAYCGFKSDDLVSHIEKKHAKEAGDENPLVAYMRKFEVDESGVIYEEPTLSADHVEIRGHQLPKGSGGLLVPETNPHYYFAKHTEDIIQDINESKKIMLVGHTGCVAGDTVINLNRGGKGFSIKIEDAYFMFSGGKRGGKSWEPRIQTKIRSLLTDQERIGLNRAVKFVQSGIKETFILTLSDDTTLRATADHEILTTKGFVALGELTSDCEVICDRTTVEVAGRSKLIYDQIMALKFHPYADTVTGAAYPDGRQYNRVPKHRVVVEAALSGISVEDFIARCKSGETDGLEFLDTATHAVHHKDGDNKNNSLENLEVLTHLEHAKMHGKENLKNFGYGSPVAVQVHSIKRFGEEMTYDVVCEDPHRNFIANGIVIHNCGKTSIIEQLAAKADQGVLRVNLNGQTTVGDFVGLWSVMGGDMVWIDGALPKAMRDGLWLILDEIDFAEAAILSNLNSVLERNGKLMLKEKGHEIVAPHPNFRIFGTANTVGCMAGQRGLYQGTNLMNEAFLDRFRCYFVDYLTPEEEIKVLTACVDRMTPKIATVIVSVGGMIREAFNKGEISATFSLRRMMDWSELLIRHQKVKEAPHAAAQVAIYSKVSPEDKVVIHGIIQRKMIG